MALRGLIGLALGTSMACFWTKKVEAATPEPTFSTRHFEGFKLGKIINLTSDTAIFRFLLPNADDEYYLPPLSTVQTQMGVAGTANYCMRHYTPVTSNGQKGYFDLIVKKQPRGKMTEHLFSLKVGEAVKFRGFRYSMNFDPSKWKNVGLIGGGTGITPLLQVIRGTLTDPRGEKTLMTLLFGNRTNDNILLKGMLDTLQQDSKGRFKVHYSVDEVKAGTEWKGLVGRMDAKMIRDTMPPPGPDMKLFVCGSDPFICYLCGTPMSILSEWSSSHPVQPSVTTGQANFSELGGLLSRLGYAHDQVYRF